MTRTYETCNRKIMTIAPRSLSLLLLTVLFGSGTMLIAQKKISRQQFSQMSVLTRASYFEDEILKAANAEGVDPNILWTIAFLETRFRPWLTSPKNAKGMMQFIPATAERFNLSDPYEPVSAIRAAAKYVKYLSKLFGGRVDSILAAYNSGEGTVSAYLAGKTLRNGQKIINRNGATTIGGVPPYSETIGYVGHGLKIYRWSVNQRIFSEPLFRADFPTAISSAVVRALVLASERGNAGDLNDLGSPPVSRLSQNAFSNNDTTGKLAPDEKPSADGSEFIEVYYDSRSGNRYLLNEGNRQKLKESGAVMINATNRPVPNNLARSRLFIETFNK